MIEMNEARVESAPAQPAPGRSCLRADVGPVRLGIVHGDATSLAGWGFAQEHLRDPAHRAEVSRWMVRGQVDAFACTHTCLPVFQGIATEQLASRPAGLRWILNNGAAGMPNFHGDGAGLLTRIATRPWRQDFGGAERRFGVSICPDVHAGAIAIEFDVKLLQSHFLTQWPAGSDAHLSYFDRIVRGPDYVPADACRVQGEYTAGRLSGSGPGLG